ncbi:hypothetical protein X928_01230 [Petrotoga miotherma DSM 10691]|uniref:Uncharacterized protein n=1 Tax=Petrotoga miotherma DSM 10691 TaxID=1434326 RepID=A0A2K1PH13_9BACT|nr:hypothetical protein X928_01230 [Petrotoga miotherma DSM 10691]
MFLKIRKKTSITMAITIINKRILYFFSMYLILFKKLKGLNFITQSTPFEIVNLFLQSF